jgi:hypothetical protein
MQMKMMPDAIYLHDHATYLHESCNAYEMLMHACNLLGAPSASFISPLLRVFAWLCTRGYMQLRQVLYKRVAAGQGPTAAPYV